MSRVVGFIIRRPPNTKLARLLSCSLSLSPARRLSAFSTVCVCARTNTTARVVVVRACVKVVRVNPWVREGGACIIRACVTASRRSEM